MGSGVVPLHLSCANRLRSALRVEEIVGRFQQELENPDPKAPFRGSLVDDNMFAIDVAEWGMDNVLWRQRQERQNEIAASTDTPEKP